MTDLNKSTDSLNAMDGNELSAKRLAMLGMLLQLMHVLFGFTAVIGMFISHMLIENSYNTVYHSHLRWQLTTFWMGLALYAAAFWTWHSLDLFWPIILVFLIMLYRIGTGFRFWLQEKPINRLL